MFAPIFDNSVRMEMQGFMTADAREGADAFREKRAPVFPSANRD
jgi:enoyl-CoA hydratase